jgi:hypothetical protein
MDNEIHQLSRVLVGEIFLSLGFSKYGWAYRLFHRPFLKVADRLSSITLTADYKIASDGFPAAAEWILYHWCSSVNSDNDQNIPQQGPLLIISNHAGTYDTFILTSRINRNDIKLISSDIPFLKNLPNASKHIIFLSENTHDRMLAARHGIQHLRNGGALLLYGTGLIDPDPAVYPDADKWIDRWLPSIDIFLRAVPEIRIVLSIVSGVVSAKWASHPITWLKKIDWQKRRLAEFSQIIQQLWRPGTLFLTPSVSFSDPLTIQDLATAGLDGDRFLPAVISRGKTLLADHCLRYGNCAILNN